MDSADLYFAVPSTTFQVRRHLSLAVCGDNHLRALDDTSVRVLRSFVGFRPLEEHLKAAWMAGVTADPRVLGEVVEKLLDGGFLGRIARPAADAALQPPVGRGVDVIAIVTCDRPQLVGRALDSAINHCRRFGDVPKLLVVDGSKNLASKTRASVDVVRQRTSCTIDYVGPSEAELFSSEMAASGVDAEALRFAATPGSIGSNRNLAVLLTAGQRVLMLDDDVLCEAWRLRDAKPGLAIAGHNETRQWRFFDSRAEALQFAGGGVQANLLQSHGDILGAPIGEMALGGSSDVDLTGACAHVVRAVSGGGECRVRVTMAGLAGDSARYCPFRLLFVPGSLRRLFFEQPEMLEMALSSREVCVIATRPTVIHDPVCASYSMGLANDALVPPFITLGRGEDSVFGAMLSLTDVGATFAHLSCGIVHDSTRSQHYDSECMPSACQTRLSEFMLAVMSRVTPAVVQQTVEERLVFLGQHIGSLAALSSAEFAAYATRVQMQSRCAQISGLEGTIDSIGGCPGPFRAALDRYVDTFEEHVRRPRFFVPIEFDTETSEDGSFAEMRLFVRKFGRVLEEWPRIWAAAARRNQRTAPAAAAFAKSVS